MQYLWENDWIGQSGHELQGSFKKNFSFVSSNLTVDTNFTLIFHPIMIYVQKWKREIFGNLVKSLHKTKLGLEHRNIHLLEFDQTDLS